MGFFRYGTKIQLAEITQDLVELIEVIDVDAQSKKIEKKDIEKEGNNNAPREKDRGEEEKTDTPKLIGLVPLQLCVARIEDLIKVRYLKVGNLLLSNVIHCFIGLSWEIVLFRARSGICGKI